MAIKKKKRSLPWSWLGAAVAAAAAAAYFWWPRATLVDLVEVTKGPMQVTVNEDGKTRVRERFIVSAPLAGRMTRVELKAGDAVEADKTQLLFIQPTDPVLLDARALAESQSRVRAAEAAVLQASAGVQQAREAHELATHRFTRAKELRQMGSLSDEDFDLAEHGERQAAQALRGSEFAKQAADFELQVAEAALIRTRPPSENSQAEGLAIHSPVSGRVLRVMRESAGVVATGEPILEIGDPTDLEVEIDVLSSDAASIRPGAEVRLEQWGGEHPLEARVRTIEPSGFTKISALGVEEQRVNVIADIVSPLEDRRSLGDAFRVEARIVVWDSAQVTKAPSGTLFRSGQHWAVFVVQNARARLQTVEVGRDNGDEAQILKGLSLGDVVVFHPGDKVRSGSRVAPRSAY